MTHICNYFDLTLTENAFPRSTVDSKSLSMLEAATVNIHGVVFTTVYRSGPSFPAEDTTMPHLIGVECFNGYVLVPSKSLTAKEISSIFDCIINALAFNMIEP
ncbi:hypothetical protein Drorol1_Dr00018877 [Drosera rotundifolia]